MWCNKHMLWPVCLYSNGILDKQVYNTHSVIINSVVRKEIKFLGEMDHGDCITLPG